MNRTNYIRENDSVEGFVAFLARVIRGDEHLNFSVGFAKSQLYEGFEKRFEGADDRRAGGGRVHVVLAQKLQHLFEMYWWGGKDFEGNMLELNKVSAKIRAAIDGENAVNAQKLAEEACHEVMKWGFGEKRRAYEANMNWAKRQGESLATVLRIGRESLSGDNPNFGIFGGDESRHIGSPRMNAGWTKYYALALPNHIIYDGRVGAALGFLVQRYLESRGYTGVVPKELQFPWASGEGGGTLRDPSFGVHQFGRLYGGRYGSRSWAQANVLANWVLSEARDLARADWCAGPDGLRRIEAALFMLGYDLRRVRDTLAEEETMPTGEERAGLRTANGNGYFEYSGSLEAGIEFFYGNNLGVTGRVSAETIQALQVEFAPLGQVRVGTSFNKPAEDSIGYWLLSRNRQNLACYLIPTLEHFGWGTYDASRRKFSFAVSG